MVLKLTQNEVGNIPRDRAEYTDLEGNVVPATTAQYLWFPLKRLKGGYQVIWVEDGADVSALTTESYTYINSDGLEVEYDMTTEIKKAKEQYVNNEMTVTSTAGNKFDANLIARQNIADGILAATTLGLTQTTWRLADNTEVLIDITELKEVQALAIQKYAQVKGIS